MEKWRRRSGGVSDRGEFGRLGLGEGGFGKKLSARCDGGRETTLSRMS